MGKAGNPSNPKKREIHSQAYFEGPVNTQGGDFVFGDKIVYSKTEFEELQAALKEAVITLRVDLVQQVLAASEDVPEEPYRYLDYFDLAHKQIFFGREAAKKELLAQIRQNRLTLVHAPSGVGKTSLLRAAILPALCTAKDLSVYIHHPGEPVAAIQRHIFPRAPHPQKLTDLPLHTFLSWVCQYLKGEERLVILLDQFEEFFIHCTPLQQKPFMAGLAECHADDSLPVHFVLAMRKDYFSDMAAFEPVMPEVFHNQYRLTPLKRSEAAKAITGPLQERQITWEAGAVEMLLNYLEQGEIETPHLQLICSRLYKQACDQKQKTIYLQGVDLEAIHARYLEDEMTALGKPPYTQVQQELGWKLLKRLVTSHGTKQTLPLSSLTYGMKSAEVDPVLAYLVNRRLIRRNDDPFSGETTLEIAHDTLAALVLEKDPEERRRKTVEELVGRGLQDWIGHKTLMDSSRLGILDKYQSEINMLLADKQVSIQWKHDALEYLLRSAVIAGQRAAEWLEHARQGGVDVDKLVKEWIGSDQRKERSAAALILGEMGDAALPQLTILLADEYPQVRMAAIAALESLQPDGQWKANLQYECYVPPGEFRMGDDHSKQSDERPVHKVLLDAYYVGKYPITNADFKRFSDDIGRPFNIPDGQAQHPVVNVNWYQANEYAAWAGMRLLTEAEWEKAASWELREDEWERKKDSEAVFSGRKRKYPWGDAFDRNKCNTEESGIGDSTPVGKYSPQGDSPYGCTDMAGNVWEWTSSLFKEYPYRPDDGREDLASTVSRVQRGGAFSFNATRSRCVCRFGGNPGNSWRNSGFRMGIGVKELVSL